MEKSNCLKEACTLWHNNDTLGCYRLLAQWAKQLEEQDCYGRALSVYIFFWVHLKVDARRAVRRLREQDLFPDLDLLKDLFLEFFPAETPSDHSLEESTEFEPSKVYFKLGDVDFWQMHGWRKTGDILLQAAASCGQRADFKVALARRALEFSPTCEAAELILRAHQEAWNEASDEIYQLTHKHESQAAKDLLFGVSAEELLERGLYKKAALKCLEESQSLERHDPERLDLTETFMTCLNKMTNLQAWKFLRQPEHQKFAGDGWLSWVLTRLLHLRKLKHEALAPQRITLARMRGPERIQCLLDSASIRGNLDSLKEAAKLAQTLRRSERTRWLRRAINRALQLGSPESLKLGLKYCKKVAALEEPGSKPSWEKGYTAELKGRLLRLQNDNLKAKDAFLLAQANYQSSKDQFRILKRLAIAADSMGDTRGYLHYARLCYSQAPASEKKRYLDSIALALENAYHLSAAAAVYQLIAETPYQRGKLADLQREAGRDDKALETLAQADSSWKANLFYFWGDLEQANIFATGYLKELIEVEVMTPEKRQSFLETRRHMTSAKLRRPLRTQIERRLQRNDLVLHPRDCHFEIRQLWIRPVMVLPSSRNRGYARKRCLDLLRTIVDYHQKEFGRWCASPKVRELETLVLGRKAFAPRDTDQWHSYATSLNEQLGQAQRKRNETVMVFHFPPGADCGFRGVANYAGFAHTWVSNSRFVDTVAVHEFYHACLQLQHSHGHAAPNDPWCLMTQGARALGTSYLQPFQKAICLTPRSVQRQIQAGRRAQSEYQWSDAISHYQSAFEEDPLHQWLAENLIYLLYRENRCFEACEVTKIHAKHHPSQKSKVNLIDALAFNGFMEEAKKIEKHFPRSGNNAEDTLLLVRAWKRAGRLNRALRIARRSLSFSNYSTELLKEIGELQWMLHQHKAAERTYLQALDRGCTKVFLPLCLMACECGEIELARMYLKDGLGHDIHTEHVEWLHWKFALREGEWETAKEHFCKFTPHMFFPDWYKCQEAIMAWIQGRQLRQNWKDVERQGYGLKLVWLAKVWGSTLDGKPDLVLLEKGCRLWPHNPNWNLARYLVDPTKRPTRYLHPTILDQIPAPGSPQEQQNSP